MDDMTMGDTPAGMKITSVRFAGMRDGDFLSFVSIVLDDCFLIKGLKLIERPSDKKKLLVMPSRKRSDGDFEDTAHPIRHEFRRMLEAAVFEAYDLQEQATQQSDDRRAYT